MAGVRKFADKAAEPMKLTLLLPETVDRQLRQLAVSRGQPVGALVRGWVTERLREAEEQKRLAEHHVFHATCPTCGSAVDVIPALAGQEPGSS